MLRLPIVFIRGLNTYGDEAIHFGPWSWKTMDHFWMKAFARRNVPAVALRNWGGPTLEDHLQRAEIEFVRATQNFEKVHLLGHSLGGLVARHLGERYSSRVLSISTLSSPHFGSHIAEKIKNPKSFGQKLVRNGYDNQPYAKTIWDITPQRIKEIFPLEKPSQILHKHSFVCRVSPQEMTLPVKLMHKTLSLNFEGDGFIEFESQHWGEVKGPYALDHLDQIGLFLHLRKRRRQLKEERFEKLVDDVVTTLQNVEKHPI